jgi:hypothetical protein
MEDKTIDTKLKRASDPARADRAMDDRAITENRVVSEEERVALYKAQFNQHILPDLPEIPGYHVCWLTTTNPRDSIHMRMRLGYEPIRAVDIPGYDFYAMKTGEWAGFIGVNEMLAFKLPMTLYQRYMNEAHVVAPYNEQQRITQVIDDLTDQAQRQGGDIIEGDGFAELRKGPQSVNFT